MSIFEAFEAISVQVLFMQGRSTKNIGRKRLHRAVTIARKFRGDDSLFSEAAKQVAWMNATCDTLGW